MDIRWVIAEIVTIFTKGDNITLHAYKWSLLYAVFSTFVKAFGGTVRKSAVWPHLIVQTVAAATFREIYQLTTIQLSFMSNFIYQNATDQHMTGCHKNH